MQTLSYAFIIQAVCKCCIYRTNPPNGVKSTMISWPLSDDQLQQPFVVTRVRIQSSKYVVHIHITYTNCVAVCSKSKVVLCSDNLIGLLIGYSFQSLHRVHERAQDQGDAQRDEERDACR